jgi:hypothetical protein
MKLTWMLPALAAFLILTGCDNPSPTLLSLDPVASDKDSAVDSALVGSWESAGDHTICVVRRDDHLGYQFTVLSGINALSFQAQLLHVEDAELLDVTPTDDNDFRVPGHALVRIWTSGGALRWAFLDSDWLKKQAEKLVTRESGGKLLLLSPAEAVRDFIAKNGASEKAYGKVATWQKLQ